MKKVFFVYVFFVVVSTVIEAKEYKIGDEGEGGGIVFYVSKEGFKVYDGMGGSVVCHYLEISKDTLGRSFWFPEHSDIGVKERGLGYGRTNTYKIVNASSSNMLTEVNCAAYRCSKYSTPSTKAGEWWLPSMDELDLIYENQKDTVLATCGGEPGYWSSTEQYDDEARLESFYTGEWYNDFPKDYKKYSVRAVRAF